MEDNTKKISVLAFIALLIVLTIYIIWPIMISIIAGLILAYLLYPVYKKILSIVKERNISAIIIILLLIFLIIVPAWFLLPIITRQIFEVYTLSQEIDLFSAIDNILPATISRDAITAFNSFISTIFSTILSGFSSTFASLSDIALKLVVVLFTFFFAMRDAEKLKEYVKTISPFSKELENILYKNFKNITHSVIFGHVIIGIIQGLLTGIGLFIFGVPQALILTVLAMFFSLFPVIGAWLVWIPASVYLLLTGHLGAGIGLILYGGILISWIDNIIRPYIVSRRTNISSGIIFVGMIGGLIVFGIFGLVLGPLILSYLIIILDAYKEKRLINLF